VPQALADHIEAMNTLLYLCYGAPRNFSEARYSILSLLRTVGAKAAEFQIVVYTDDPGAFADLGIETVEIDEALLLSWLDGKDYIHRRKTMTVIDALSRFGGAVAFVDCDTYYLKPVDELFSRIGPGRACLHLVEGRLQETKSKVDQSVSKLIRDQTFYGLDGKALTISEDARMWNSGVIGIHYTDAALMNEALYLTDQMWCKLEPYAPGKKAHHLEQFATGYFLERLHLVECDDVVYHYWPEYLRDPFGERVTALVQPRHDLSLQELADKAFRDRPQADLMRKLKMRIRSALRHIGFRVPGMRNSA
jgi:hypothetical protein